MKTGKTGMKALMVAAVIAALCGIGWARQQASTASDAEQVWAKEEAYWRYVQAHDVEHFAALWSEDFAGWPSTSDHPAHKEQIVAGFKSQADRFPLSHVAAYQLQRESVEVHGGVVITFYRATTHRRAADGTETTTTSRLTHTWMKRDDPANIRNRGNWQIVGGMSAIDGQPAHTQ